MDSRDNVKVEVEDGTVVIRCAVEGVSAVPSKSGKSMIYASTGGAKTIAVGDEVFSLNLNLYRKH